jgi:hypothetical protein
MASQQTPEARELALVGNVEFRIASASTDRKLEELLEKFLAPLLLKLASESMAVRNKVSICLGTVYCSNCRPPPILPLHRRPLTAVWYRSYLFVSISASASCRHSRHSDLIVLM